MARGRFPMAQRVQVTDDYLVAVPDEARRRLNIERGDSLLVEVRDNVIILMPEPHDYARRLRGLHREVWEGIDVDEYLRREREAWES
jgi:AbrB family looped-hinge helix DNA binding protein